MDYVSRGVEGNRQKRAVTNVDAAADAINPKKPKPAENQEDPDDDIDVHPPQEPHDDTQHLAQLICTANNLKAKAEGAQKVAEATAAAAGKANLTIPTLEGQIADFWDAQEKATRLFEQAENELCAARAKLANTKKEKTEALIVTGSAATVIQEAKEAWSDYGNAKESVAHYRFGLQTAAVAKANCLKIQLEEIKEAWKKAQARVKSLEYEDDEPVAENREEPEESGEGSASESTNGEL